MRKMYKTVITFGMMVIPFAGSAQVSTLGNSGLPNDYLGWDNTNNFPLQIRHNANQPINFFTNNLMRATFTTGNAFGTGTTQGDGFRIFDTSGGPGHLDLWTSASTQTHIRWNGSGTIQGMNSRLEM